MLAVKESSYAGAKCPDFWSGCEFGCLMSPSLSQCHQGGLAIFSLSHSWTAKACETKLAHLSACLDQNSLVCPDLTCMPGVQNPGKVQGSPSLHPVHLRKAVCTQVLPSECATQTSSFAMRVGRVLLKEI